MSLQVGYNGTDYISQYSKYGSELAGNSLQQAAQMKKTGSTECRTCQSRKYVDGSSDPGVSFKAPTHVSLQSSGAAVMAHEQEHVTRERAKAQREDRKVIAQSVQVFIDICPECGRAYTSGGKTTTVTKSDNKSSDYFMDNVNRFFEKHFGKYIDIRV